MTHYSLLNCEIEVDEVKTQQWYAQAEDWGCDCQFCVNFLETAKQSQLPAMVLDLLSIFAIPPEKATYVCCLNTDREKPLYQFSYRIAGNILKSSPSATVGAAGFCHETYPYGAPGFPEPHFDLEFIVRLPWVMHNTAQ